MMTEQLPNHAETLTTSRLVRQLALPLEDLINLMFVTEKEAEHPERVRFLMRMAQERLAMIRQITVATVPFKSDDYPRESQLKENLKLRG
jgi:hypothetical protein